jgi:flavin-dependent dehydrogenase
MISSKTTASFDVAVIGGGPAGTTVATLLAQKGYRCLVVDSSTFPRYHIGESLVPHTYGTLDRLGLLSSLRESQFPVKHSVRFVSVSGKEAAPFYFSDTIEGPRATTWQVGRSEFDQLCLDNARDAGVEVRSATKVSKVLFEGDRAVGLRICGPEGDQEDIATNVVVDASGRSTIIGRQLGLRSDIAELNKASIWTYYQGGHRGDGIDAGETTVFMLPGRGWFWYIPLQDDMVSVGVVASPEYLFRESQHYQDVFPREVENCSPLKNWLSGAKQVHPLRGIRRLAYLNRQVAGNGWVMVGDAAGFLDPIYSSGIFLALASGELAADCIHQALDEHDVSAPRLGAFVPQLWEGIEVIYRLVQAFYDPAFSFHEFARRFPSQRAALINCLVGDVVGKDMHMFLDSVAQMTPPPAPLHNTTNLLEG